MKKELLAERIESHLYAEYGKSVAHAGEHEYWTALSRAVMELIGPSWEATRKLYQEGRTVHYFSAEFLVGRSLLNNLINRELLDVIRELVDEAGFDFDAILNEETDPALGNGGLGRLAACFIDSSATMELPVIGHGLLYRYGLFRQEIEHGHQKEYPDAWMELPYPFLATRREDKVLVRYRDMDVYAVPWDLPVTGWGTKNVNTIRLWKVEPAEEFDFNLFNSQRFDDAVIMRNRVQDICRVLYPNDTTYDGKVLRVRQQYFFVSASLQTIVSKYRELHGYDFSHFADKNIIQLNDTHPVLAIPELMRLLIDENQQSWDEAWEIVTNVFAFTNHTIMQEALEKWDIEIFRFLFPRILEIIEMIDKQFREQAFEKGHNEQEIDALAPIHDNQIHMALLAIYACNSINGVAKIHSEILKHEVFNPFYRWWPDKFRNKTNGVTPRRWLNLCNPDLSAMLTRLSGTDAWLTDMDRLFELKEFANDTHEMRNLLEVKAKNKERLADLIREREGIDIDTSFIFDVQIKRLHEYKRQLMNALEILDRYYKLKENPLLDMPPVAYIFGAKAAPGYFLAKATIKFINEIASIVNDDLDVSHKMRVIFMHNYNVSLAEKIFPAADVSEQISTVGMEASGTGNMKFMMNGALTVGTYDGANIEILQQVGEDNAFMFGPRLKDFPATKKFYASHWQYENIEGLKRVVDTLVSGAISDGNTGMFRALYNRLLQGSSYEKADPYYVLGDFDDYRETRNRAYAAYRNQINWAKMCWNNICASGHFSSDRSIRDYAEDIWKVERKNLG
ncbi:MAG TPA: glycogen/starch/alpha-glucan phosphorylase [Bacillota bacterium]|nr:glycogen/starch/alpha-glucan phosphorylase [Bacillota bacterium]HQC48218.1 glycogen/starch/alpha-glucan phosphorylase [Bacillota bacterium]